MSELFKKVAVIGLGLIGSSLTRAISENGIALEVAGFDRDEGVRDAATDIGIGAEIYGDLRGAVKGADLVIMSVPVGVIGQLVKEMAPFLNSEAILTDVGSVKGEVIKKVLPHLPPSIVFVPGHPVAGTEQSGPGAGFASLFDGRWCILTPIEGTPSQKLELVRSLWERVGSLIEEMDAEHHDMVLAITSHIPHLIAYNIVGTAADLEEVTESEVIKYSAGGFRDFTRIAASDPVMWRDVFMNNQTAVLEMLGRFVEDLTELQKHIRRGNSEELEALFLKTRKIRQSIVEAGQETDKPDFGR